MNPKQPNNKKNYKVSLILSATVLFVIFAIIIFQILRLQSSGNLIVSNLKESKDLNSSVLHLDSIEEKLEMGSLSVRFLDSIENKNQKIIARFDVQQPNFKTFKVRHNKLYQDLGQLIAQADTTRNNISKIKNLINEGRTLKKQLMSWHNEEIEANSSIFAEKNSLYPKLFVISTLIGFIILIISLNKIFGAQKEIDEKSSILDSILENTNDIANFYEPVYNNKKEVIDFKITYASKANISLTDVPYDNLVGELVSTTFPFLKASGLFKQLVNAYVNQEYFEKTLEIPIENDTRYFKARYIPVKTGLQVMVTELTKLYDKQEELEESNLALSLQNRLFQEAEEVALLGSYVWYMREDRSEMSDNVFRILGFEPQSFPMSASKFRDFTHPSDLEAYDNAIRLAYENNTPIEFTFRIIDKNKKIKYIYTKGNFGERDGEQIMVGIIQDVSKLMADQNQLKEQNIELISRNTELDSFNHAVSHDLQEPLRKIQMFISRISDLEEDTLSERSTTYFNKIETAATRMRRLIDNLLAFSRIDSKDYDFETVDLNDTFNDVLDTFSESISQLKAEIKVDTLPTINAIPFLMEQLFTNIIGNALKYSAKDRVTRVVIESSKIHSKQIPQEFIKTHAYYHIIKVMDNGIGFNQDEVEKIFQLFQRLHGKGEYSGTGLGLAICQKIVLKHHGHIYATSIPDKGSIFTIYLPSGKLKMLPKI